MSFIGKPKVSHPGMPRNALGLSLRDYEGSMSTLCAGCGHDSITAALVQAAFELAIPPHRMAKLSGIGCSSKTPAYFASASHGFNSVHGRMPSVATGANAASGELVPRLQRMSSTTFDAQLKVATLVARDNPYLYFDIQTLNDFGTASLQALRAATERIERLVQSGDEAGFVELMAAGRRYLENRT